MRREHRESVPALVLSFCAFVLLSSTVQNAGAQACAAQGNRYDQLHAPADLQHGPPPHRWFLAKVGQSTNMAVYVEGEYAFTDRLSVSAGLPYVFAKYTARNLPPPPIPVLSWDACHCWQSGFQDFAFSARYNVFNGGFALTPSVSFGTPSHNYEFRGEAVVGRNLKELRGITAIEKRDW